MYQRCCGSICFIVGWACSLRSWLCLWSIYLFYYVLIEKRWLKYFLSIFMCQLCRQCIRFCWYFMFTGVLLDWCWVAVMVFFTWRLFLLGISFQLIFIGWMWSVLILLNIWFSYCWYVVIYYLRQDWLIRLKSIVVIWLWI